MTDTKISDADRDDAFGVLHWLLTERQDVLHVAAMAAAEGDAVRTAVIANAGRAWSEACRHLAHVCETQRDSHG